MKAKSTLRSFLLGCSSLLVASSLPAAPLYWDGTTTGADADGGDGTWIDDSGTTTNWDDAATGGANTSWTNANTDTAVFGGATGAVTIDAGGVTVGGLQFDTAGYTLSGGVLTFGAAGSITANENATISSALAGSAAIEKAGTASLTLSGVNTSFTGPLTLSAGTVILNSTTAPGSGTLTFSNGGTAPATAVFGFANTYTNPVTVAAGSTGVNTIQTTNLTGTVKLDGAVTINTGTTLKLDNSGSVFDIGTGVITGNGGLETTGTSLGNFIFRGANTYSGGSLLSGSGIHVPALSTTGPDGSPTSGPFGTGTLTINNATFRSTTGADTSIGNTVILAGNLTAINVNSEKSLTFAGPVTLTETRTITSTVGNTVPGKTLTFSGDIDDGPSSFGITKQGSGVLILSGTNTFGSFLNIGLGTVRVGSESAVGSHAEIRGSGAVSNTVFASADATPRTLNKTFTTAATGGGITFGDTTGTGNLTFTDDLSRLSGSTDRSVNVAGSTTTTFNGNLLSPGTPAAATTFTKGGTGTLAIKGTGSGTDLGFSQIVITGGTFAVTRLADLGVASSLSRAANATAGAVSITLDGGALSYIDGGGAASSTNRLLQIGRTTAAITGTIRNNATDALETVTFSNTGAIAYGNIDQTRTLILGGTNTGLNTLASAIGNNGIAAVSLTKQDAGTWILTGTNTYSGITSLNAGVLRLDSTNALPGGITNTGGTGALSFNGGALGLGSGDFTRNYGGITAGTIGRFDVVGNTGPWWAAYGADRNVNVNGAGATFATFNGKPFNFGAADATNMLTYVNGVNMTTATRQVIVYRGSTPGGIDARFSGALTTSGANMAGWLVSGGGTIAFTGANTFAGRINVFAGTVVVNSLTTTGSSSPIGNGTSGIGLAGGTFRYAPVAGSGGAGHSTNHNFTITESSSMDASGTGALVFNAPSGNIISPDLTGVAFTATGANKTLNIATTNYPALAIGMTVTGPGIAAGSTIASFSTTAINLTSSANVTSTSGNADFGFATSRTLTLTGTNTDANTIGGNLQDSSTTGAGVLSITKAGIGTWSLSGANTYTGATTVSEGTLALVGGSQASPITVTSGASLGFTLLSPTTSTSSVDLTNGTVKITSTVDNASDYLLMTASTISGTPVLSSPIPNYTLQKAAGNTQLKLVYSAGGSAYDTWEAINAPTTGNNPSADEDGDGVSNAVEFVLGGTAASKDLGKLPVAAASGSNMTFTFVRDQDSVDGSTLVTIEVGNSLATWPSSYSVGADTGSSTAGVVVTDNLNGTDTVVLTVTQAPDTKKFARLKAVVTP